METGISDRISVRMSFYDLSIVYWLQRLENGVFRERWSLQVQLRATVLKMRKNTDPLRSLLQRIEEPTRGRTGASTSLSDRAPAVRS